MLGPRLAGKDDAGLVPIQMEAGAAAAHATDERRPPPSKDSSWEADYMLTSPDLMQESAESAERQSFPPCWGSAAHPFDAGPKAGRARHAKFAVCSEGSGDCCGACAEQQ